MKAPLASFMIGLLAGCGRAPAPPSPQAPQGVSDIQSPTTSLPPVQTAPYEAGYQAGDLAGEASVRARRAEEARPKLEPPTEHGLAVLALEAAGADPARAHRWQRGYIAGFRDGFIRAAEGKK